MKLTVKHTVAITEIEPGVLDVKCLDCTRHWVHRSGVPHFEFLDHGDKTADHSGMINEIPIPMNFSMNEPEVNSKDYLSWLEIR